MQQGLPLVAQCETVILESDYNHILGRKESGILEEQAGTS